MASAKQAADIAGKSPVRTEMADKTKKVGKLTVNIRQSVSEEKGDAIETHEVEDRGQVIARYVKKDGQVLESAATPDAQLTGVHEKQAKAAGVNKDDVVFTTPAMNAAESEVEETGDQDEGAPSDPLGEDAKLTEKTKEKKPKAKPAQGKKPDNSMSKMGSEKTGEQDKKGDRDLSKELKKADTISEIAEHQSDKQSKLERQRDSSANMLKLLETVKKFASGPRVQYDPKTVAPLSNKIRGMVAERQNSTQPNPGSSQAPMAGGPMADPVPTTPTLAKTMPEPWHNPAAHDQDQKMEVLLEEKMKRKFPGPQPKLTKAEDDPAEGMRRMRVEHSAQHKLNQYTPGTPKAPKEGRALPKTPNYKLLTPMESNAKTAKNEGVEGSGGENHFSAILHLAPATLAGVGNVCEGSTTGCRDACLNTAGRGGMFKAGEGSNTIQAARIRKTQQLAKDPGKFMDDLVHDINQVQRHAEASKSKPVVRLNGTSDLAWEDMKLPHFQGKNLFEAFPGIQFYDYTKRPDRVMRNKHANYHLTFSQSDRNKNVVPRMLSAGHNVAVVFGGKQLPKTYKGHPVVSGDEHDLRFLDPRGGHVIGLKAKGDAKADKTGFVEWDHEGNPEGLGAKEGVTTKLQRMAEASKKMGKSNSRRDVVDFYLRKAKQEQYHSPRGKRVIREERRQAATPDPIAKPRPELPGSKGAQPLKKDDQSGGWIQKKPGLPQVPPATKPPRPAGAIKEGPALDYAKINKIKTQSSANTIDYSKFPTPPAQEPNWKKKMRAGQEAGAAPRAVIRKAEPDMNRPLKKDDPNPMAAGVTAGTSGGTMRTGGPTVAPGAASAMAAAFGKTAPPSAQPLNKDNKPHAPGSPADSAHDVAEEGSSLKGELKQLGVPEKMSQMLQHLRTLKGGHGLRSPANQAVGKDPVAKSEPEERENTPGNRKRAKDDYESDMKNRAKHELQDEEHKTMPAPMAKAAGAPAAPATPAKGPTIPSALTKPKKPTAPKPKLIMANYAATAAPAAGAAMGKAEHWPVPGKVPPKMPERPAKPMAKHVPGVSDEKYDSCVKQVKAKGTGNAYAICTASLKKCCDIMRNGSQPLEKAVVDLKTGKNVPATAARKQAQPPKPAPGVSFAEKKAVQPKIAPAPQAPTAAPVAKKPTTPDEFEARKQRIASSLSKINGLMATLKAHSAEKAKKEAKYVHPEAERQHANFAATQTAAKKAPASVTHIADAPEPTLRPKAEGYDFNAAAKQNAAKKAKQAEEIKNQDVKGKIARGKRG